MRHGPNRRTMGIHRASYTRSTCARGWARASLEELKTSSRGHPVDSSNWCAMERPPEGISTVPDMPPPFPAVGRRQDPGEYPQGPCEGFERTRRHRRRRSFHRWHLRRGQKRGFCVGPTKRGKGTKVMAIADRSGLPVAVCIESASPHESKLVERTLDSSFIEENPRRLIGDKAYDSNALDARLEKQRGVELIAPNISGRKKTQDGRCLRRYRRRWKVERLFAWLHNFRRLVVRYEYHADNYLGFLQLGCIVILLRNL
jgi:transposase